MSITEHIFLHINWILFNYKDALQLFYQSVDFHHVDKNPWQLKFLAQATKCQGLSKQSFPLVWCSLSIFVCLFVNSLWRVEPILATCLLRPSYYCLIHFCQRLQRGYYTGIRPTSRVVIFIINIDNHSV